jgi:VanZ family protein
MDARKSRKTAWVATPLLAGAIAVLSFLPHVPNPTPQLVSADKIAHVGVYLLLGLSAGTAVGRGWRRRLAAFLLCAAYGGLIELVQPAVGRSADLHDWAADVIGGALGLLGTVWLGRTWAQAR